MQATLKLLKLAPTINCSLKVWCCPRNWDLRLLKSREIESTTTLSHTHTHKMAVQGQHLLITVFSWWVLARLDFTSKKHSFWLLHLHWIKAMLELYALKCFQDTLYSWYRALLCKPQMALLGGWIRLWWRGGYFFLTWHADLFRSESAI